MRPQQVENVGIVNSVDPIFEGCCRGTGSTGWYLNGTSTKPFVILYMSVDCEDVGFEETPSQGH